MKRVEELREERSEESNEMARLRALHQQQTGLETDDVLRLPHIQPIQGP